MAFTDEQAVRAALSIYEPAIFKAVHDGWRDWQSLALNGRLLFAARSRACLVYDFIVQRAIAMLDGESGVRIFRRDETAKFIFADSVVMRFKKANGRGLGSNIETQATLGFVDQQQELPGLGNVHKVEVVYVLNALQTQISDVLVAARDGDIRLWTYPIAPETTAEVITLQTSATPIIERVARVKLRVATDGDNNRADKK